MKKKAFELGADVEAALQNLAELSESGETSQRAEPSAVNPPMPVRESHKYVPAPDADVLLTWYRAMKPRTMGKFLWMIFFQWQAQRSSGVIVLDEMADLLGVKRERVAHALADLAKAGWITITATERGPRRTIISRTIVVNASKRC